MISCLGLPVMTGWVMQSLPGGLCNLLSVWIAMSFPIAILIGHCVLSED
jgi:hypothetical protein